MNALTLYFALTKPRLLPLVLFSGLPAIVLAAGYWPSPGRIVWILTGIALAAGAANALNSYLERDRDRAMQRTVTRPLPAGLLPPQRALAFGLLLSLLGPGLLWLISGPAAAAVALGGILFYVFVYTIWLKPRSPIAVVVGGVAGAVSPLIADAAVSGSIGVAGWMLFAIVFAWQPPHFWAITLYRRAEYEAAGFPLMVSRIGPERTERRILGWILALIPISLLPNLVSTAGSLYAVAAIGLGVWFATAGLKLVRVGGDDAARHVFRVSLIYLMGILLALIVDLSHSLVA